LEYNMGRSRDGYSKEYRDKHHDKILEYHRAYYKKNKRRLKEYQRLYRKTRKDPAEERKYQNEWRRRRKAAAISAYGGKCACCGETEPAFLTIDHENGDGSKHRAAIHAKPGQSTYNWLAKNGYPKGFQVLCWNCNSGRAVNGGVCPHQKGK
jgi:hypothetical protein